ncbi:hypothetical protein GCM10010394_22920 [Streptomyces crystallinus]|uniref:Uncharacterized protein n=1 Tax=Streptomyces crystallinus TaxID=68191 RepID=A0ABN1FL27_9ACTN
MKYRSSSGWATICMTRAPLEPSWETCTTPRVWIGEEARDGEPGAQADIAADRAMRPATRARRAGSDGTGGLSRVGERADAYGQDTGEHDSRERRAPHGGLPEAQHGAAPSRAGGVGVKSADGAEA